MYVSEFALHLPVPSEDHSKIIPDETSWAVSLEAGQKFRLPQVNPVSKSIKPGTAHESPRVFDVKPVSTGWEIAAIITKETATSVSDHMYFSSTVGFTPVDPYPGVYRCAEGVLAGLEITFSNGKACVGEVVKVRKDGSYRIQIRHSTNNLHPYWINAIADPAKFPLLRRPKKGDRVRLANFNYLYLIDSVKEVPIIKKPYPIYISGVLNKSLHSVLDRPLTLKQEFVNPQAEKLLRHLAYGIDDNPTLLNHPDVTEKFKKLAYDICVHELPAVSWMKEQIAKGSMTIPQWEAFTFFVFSRAWRIYNLISGAVPAVHAGGYPEDSTFLSHIAADDGGNLDGKSSGWIKKAAVKAFRRAQNLKNLFSQAETANDPDDGTAHTLMLLRSMKGMAGWIERTTGEKCRVPSFGIDRVMNALHQIREEKQKKDPEQRMFGAGRLWQVDTDFEDFKNIAAEKGWILPGFHIQENGRAPPDPRQIFDDALYFLDLLPTSFGLIESCGELALRHMQTDYKKSRQGLGQFIARLEPAIREALAGKNGPIDAFDWGVNAFRLLKTKRYRKFYRRAMEYVWAHTSDTVGKKRGYEGSTEDEHARRSRASVTKIIRHLGLADCLEGLRIVTEINQAQRHAAAGVVCDILRLENKGRVLKFQPA